jgi:hypothetical protein
MGRPDSIIGSMQPVSEGNMWPEATSFQFAFTYSFSTIHSINTFQMSNMTNSLVLPSLLQCPPHCQCTFHLWAIMLDERTCKILVYEPPTTRPGKSSLISLLETSFSIMNTVTYGEPLGSTMVILMSIIPRILHMV